MAESRWLRWIGPGVVALGAVALIASTTLGAGTGRGGRAPAPVRRATRSPRRGSRHRPRPRTCAARRGSAWTRCSTARARCAASGSSAGIGDGRPEPAADLPAGVLRQRTVRADRPRRVGRRLRVAPRRPSTSPGGCTWTLATERDVIRRATVDPAGATIYETRVDRTSRADLGVWQRPLDGGPARRILDPLPADARFGRTFSTEFTWAADGERLAIQSCGEVACRTRIIARDGSLAGDARGARSRRPGRVRRRSSR